MNYPLMGHFRTVSAHGTITPEHDAYKPLNVQSGENINTLAIYLCQL